METVQQPDPAEEVVVPEIDVVRPLIPTTIEDNETDGGNSSCGLVIKKEPQDGETNAVSNEIEMPITNEPQENSEIAEDLSTNLESSTETTVRMIKQEPDNEDTPIDRDIPIGKDSNDEILLDRDIPIGKDSNDEIPLDRDMPIAKDSNYINGNQFATPVPTDDFLDGIATAIAPSRPPRLRVKTEFSLRENLSSQEATLEKNVDSHKTKDYLNDNNLNKETALPPPPPSLSSHSTSELLADGIATPRISLLALRRLKVKTEFSQPDNTEEASVLPAEFFDDLLKAKSPKEAGEVSGTNSDTDFEDIPPDFFDDLLPDELKENFEQDDNQLEEKYSERLKEKERLKNAYKSSMEKSKHRRHKKQKKTKKKSRKRSRSRSPVHSKTDQERDHRSTSPASYSKEHKRCRRLSNSQDNPSSSKDYYQEQTFKSSDSLWATDACKRIKQEFENADENQTLQVKTTVENVEEFNEILTPKQKRERAIKRATALLNKLRNSSSSSENFITSTFQFVSTVRKLPTSHSYVQQRIYENRSPLHTINNVSYKFNSYTTRFNMEEWGLAALTTHAAKMAKLIGCDAQFIYEKLKTTKIPPKLKKMKQENMECADEEGEELVESNSSLFCNVMTQTDDDYNTLRKGKGHDIGVQAEPSVYSIGSQTLETQLPTENLHKDDEAPIMNIIRDLNENQLMALHSFAELIKEPTFNTNAMDMYKIQMKIMEIYKISQIPSALATPQTEVTNNYTTSYSSPSKRRESFQPKPIIQSVRSADGTQFSINDPRTKSVAYAGRVINNCDDVGTVLPTNVDPRLTRLDKGNTQSTYRDSRPYVNESRYYGSTHPMQSSSSTYRQQQSHTNHQLPTTSATAKRYGRGALRR